MITRQNSLAPDYFEHLYADDPDPWRFASSEYERNKYAETVAVLSGRTCRSAFEVGCSIGILTKQMSPLCHTLLAVDVATRALNQAKRNCAGMNNVRFVRMQIPTEWPTDTFDLIVLSEVLYYFCPEDIDQIVHRILSTLLPQGVVLLVHWTGSTNYPCQGDEAVERFREACGPSLTSLVSHKGPHYRLDLLLKKD